MRMVRKRNQEPLETRLAFPLLPRCPAKDCLAICRPTPAPQPQLGSIRLLTKTLNNCWNRLDFDGQFSDRTQQAITRVRP